MKYTLQKNTSLKTATIGGRNMLQAVYTTINLHICMRICWFFLP